jgi:uncharacterized paraquat-inducible protein A
MGLKGKLMDEHRCEECESIFTVEFVDGLSDGVVSYCPFCGEEITEGEEDD